MGERCIDKHHSKQDMVRVCYTKKDKGRVNAILNKIGGGCAILNNMGMMCIAKHHSKQDRVRGVP